MLKSQKLQLEMSDKRKAINEMSQSENFNVDELDALNKEYLEMEVKYSSALISEAEEYRATPTDDLDAEGKEQRGIEARISVANYVSAAVEGRELDGAEAEYNASRNLTGIGVQTPWEALLDAKERVHLYAATTSPETAEVNQQEVLERVFANGAAAYLGVRMQSVAVGAENYPVINKGVKPVNTEAGGSADQTAATLTPNLLNPIRLTAEYLVRYEDTYKFKMMEEALRTDLGGAMSEAMDLAIVSGNGTAPNVSGFLKALTAPDDPTAVAKFEDYASARAGEVDGRYAQSEDDVKVLVGAETYRHAAGIYQAGSGTSALSRLMPMVSPHIPAPASNIQKAIACKRAGRAVAPMWPSIGLIQDTVSGAGEGQITITAIALWNFQVLDTDAYAQLKFKLA